MPGFRASRHRAVPVIEYRGSLLHRYTPEYFGSMRLIDAILPCKGQYELGPSGGFGRQYER
jgi:hypothetical protein